MGLGSHCQVTEQPSRQAWKGRSPRNRRDLVRGRRGAWGSQDGMDLPDPIGWQLERKQREWEREGGRELVRRGQPSRQGRRGGQWGQMQRRVWQGLWNGGEERGKVEGRSWRCGTIASPGSEVEEGGPPPATHSGLTHTTRQGTHGSRHAHGPLCLPSSLAPLSFNPLAQGHP